MAPGGGDFVPQLGTDAGAVVGLSDVIPINLPGPGNTTRGGSGGSGGSGGGGASACLTVSTLQCTPAGSGGASSICITQAQYQRDTGTTNPLPAACAPSGAAACMNPSTLALVKPCCPGLTCKVASSCGGGSTVGGVCL